MNTNRVFRLGILGAIFLIVPMILGGLLIPNYNHLEQFISESYAINTQYGIYLRIFGYIPSGIFIALFAFFAIRTLPKSKLTSIGLLVFGISYGIGTIIVSIFPCDAGCNRELIDPSFSQLIHNLFGAIVYLFTPFCLILIGIKAKYWNNGKGISTTSIICGSIAILSVILSFSDFEGNYIGLYQRVFEASIIFWMMKLSFYIKHYKQN
ncbi:MAG: DUF998 domain-containing protein [Flavobacteriaceae bacterium]|nr:DUF998 domain-containing protein [Flavobacteriaceae bacterium]